MPPGLPINEGGVVTGRFTFVFTEKEVSLMLDALEFMVEACPGNLPWTREEYAELAGEFAYRFSW